MGIRSSYTIKKEVAQQVLISSILTASDEVLEVMLEALPQSTYRNYSIDEEGAVNAEGESTYYHISTVAEFETK